MAHVAAGLEDVLTLFDTVELVVDPMVIDRIVELCASIDEIEEAMTVEGSAPSTADPPPSSSLVAEIRALLAELLADRHLGELPTFRLPVAR